jgi:hypothetical protein
VSGSCIATVVKKSSSSINFEEVRFLLRRHPQLEPVARATCGQHEVVGRAELARSKLFGDETRGEMIGHPRSPVLFREHEGAEAELRAFAEELPRNALFPVRFAIERHRLRLDLLLRELAREVPELALLLRQADVEHDYLVSGFFYTVRSHQSGKFACGCFARR